MDLELEKVLVKKYPRLFRYYGGPVTKTCMAFGCDCGNGWFKLLDDLCNELKDYDVVLAQVKEKFGGLRVYVGEIPKGKFDTIQNILDKYEEKSYKVCEWCGREGKFRDDGWLITLCDDCEYKRRLK